MSPIDFQGRVAIVTGAGHGLGREYALQLAARGASVVVNDIGVTSEGGERFADRVVAEIQAQGGKAVANYDAVGPRPACNAIFETAMDHFGRLDIVINNAGNQRNARFEDMSDEDFDAVIDVHLKGAFYLSQNAYKVMMQQKYGRILFTSSSSAMFGNHIRANYSAAKAGLVGLTHTVSIEGERYGILANALLPCSSVTLLGKSPEGCMHPDWEATNPRFKPGIELVGGRNTPAHVAPLVLYLVSERCRSTHAIWSALGGRYARAFIGCTKGWLSPHGHVATPEDIEAHLALIENRVDFDEPLSVSDEFDPVIAALKQRQA